MFDYVSAQEVRLLCNLQLPGFQSYLLSNQRIRPELLGLVKDEPSGIQLTSKSPSEKKLRSDRSVMIHCAAPEEV